MSESQLSTVAPEPSVAIMLQGMLQGIQAGAITPQTVDVMKGMMDLYQANQKRQDQRDFAAALTALQGETIRVAATKKVDEKADGTCRYRFAAYESIMEQVQPILTRHGFSITFDTEVGDQRLTCTCILTHSSGEVRQNRFAVRYGKPPGSSEAQGDMSTMSYAKRGALCNALNIVIDHDDDARTVGAPIDPDTAKLLEDRCIAAKINRRALLAMAGAATFAEIGETRLAEVEAMIAKKERERLANPEHQHPTEQHASEDFKF